MTTHRYAFRPSDRKTGDYSTWAPLCGQRDSRGTGWAHTRYTDDPSRVDCLDFLKAMSDAVTAPRLIEIAGI